MDFIKASKRQRQHDIGINNNVMNQEKPRVVFKLGVGACLAFAARHTN